MRTVDFDTLSTAATGLVSEFGYTLQPRVDGDFVSDTCRSIIIAFARTIPL